MILGTTAAALIKHSEGADKAKTSTDGLKDSTDELATSLKNVADAQKDALTNIGDQQTETFNALREIQTAEETHTQELVKQLAILRRPQA